MKKESAMAYDNLRRLPDPTTTPKGPGFTSQSLLDNAPGMTHDLNSGGTLAVKYAGNYWTIDVSYPKLRPEEAQHIVPFINSLQGGFQNIYVKLPTKCGISSANEADRLIEQTASLQKGSVANSFKIPYADIAGLAKTPEVGDFIKLSNGKKLYEIYGVVQSGLSDMELFLNSEVLSDINTAKLMQHNVMFRVRLTNKPKFTLGSDGLYNAVTLNFRENIL